MYDTYDDTYDDIFVNAISLILVYHYFCGSNDIISMESQTYDNLQDKSCIICFEEYDSQSKDLIYKLKCKHIFHKDCLDTWFKKNPTCPLCRTDINFKHSIS